MSIDTMPTPRLRAGGWYVLRQNEPVRAQLVRETTPGLLYEGEGEREAREEKREELEVLKSTGHPCEREGHPSIISCWKRCPPTRRRRPPRTSEAWRIGIVQESWNRIRNHGIDQRQDCKLMQYGNSVLVPGPI